MKVKQGPVSGMAAPLMLPFLGLSITDIGARRKAVIDDSDSETEDGSPVPSRRARRASTIVTSDSDNDDARSATTTPTPASPPAFRLTVRTFPSVKSFLMGEARDFVANHVSIAYDGTVGPDQYLTTQLNRGFALPHGCLVYGRATREAPGLKTDDMVCALLVAANARDWAGSARHGRTFTVYALAVHDDLRRSGAARAMWATLEEQHWMRSGKVTLIVEGGPCLNNPASRTFYESLGFAPSCDNKAGRDNLCVVLTYRDGVRGVEFA